MCVLACSGVLFKFYTLFLIKTLSVEQQPVYFKELSKETISVNIGGDLRLPASCFVSLS